MEDKKNQLDLIVDDIYNDYLNGRDIDRNDFFGQPDQDVVVDIIKKLLMILYPGYYRDETFETESAHTRLAILVEDVMHSLRHQIEVVLVNDPAFRDKDKSARREAAEEMTFTSSVRFQRSASSLTRISMQPTTATLPPLIK